MKSAIYESVAAVLLTLTLWPTGSGAAQDAPEMKQTPEQFAKKIQSAMRRIGRIHITPATDAQMVRWVVLGLYQGVNEPLPEAIGKRLKTLERANAEELGRVLRDVRARLGDRKELANNNDVAMALQGIFVGLEPGAYPKDRSRYIPPEENSCDCNLFVRGLTGIGIKLQSDPATGMLRVVTPVFNGPAHKAGIRGGDLITHIQIDTDIQGKLLMEADNQDELFPRPRIISTKGLTVEEAYKLILGKEGTRVVLTVVRTSRADK